MNTMNVCPVCATVLSEDTLDGLCPKCLMAAAGPQTGDTFGENTPTLLDTCQAPWDNDPFHSHGYTVLSERARGGMGRVLVVRDHRIEREVALKELLPDSDGSGSGPTDPSHPLASRFLREARITGQLEHPSITPVHELGRKPDGSLYYTMKLIRGKTLSQAIREAKDLSERLKLLPHFVNLCHAAAYAHSRGVIHRDIKPQNVMIGEFGETVLIDWGLAKVKSQVDVFAEDLEKSVRHLRAADSDDSGATTYGTALGTPAYMPPEQAMGQIDRVDERSDIYSLGAVLYELLTGHPPFQGRTPREIVDRVLDEAPRSPRTIDRHIPVDLAKACMKALSKKCEDRFATAKELAQLVQSSKLRRPKGPLRRTLEVLSALLIVGVPLLITLMNWRSDAAMEVAMVKAQAAGIDLSIDYTAAMYRSRGAESDTLRERLDQPVNGDSEVIEVERNGLGAIYGLGLRYPNLSNRFYALCGGSWEADWMKDLSHPLTTEASTRIEVTVSELRPIISEILDIAHMPNKSAEAIEKWTARSDPFTTEIPEFMTLRTCARILAFDAHDLIEHGQSDAGFERISDILRFGSQIEEAPSSIMSLIWLAVIDEACVTLSRIPTSIEAKTDQIVGLRRLLIESEAGATRSILRHAALDTQVFYGAVYSKGMHDGIDSAIWPDSGSPFYLRPLIPVANTLRGTNTFRFWKNYDFAALLEDSAFNQHLLALPYFEARGQFISRPASPSLLYPIYSQALPNAEGRSQMLAKAHARIRQALIALAIREYRHTHAALPESLDALVPAYLDSVPADPFTGRSMEFESTETGCLLISMGKDGSRKPETFPENPKEAIQGALYRYRKDHQGKYPESLDRLVPEYLPTVPRDPFSGQPYRYTIDKMRVNFGLTRLDENGEASTFDPWEEARDIEFVVY